MIPTTLPSQRQRTAEELPLASLNDLGHGEAILSQLHLLQEVVRMKLSSLGPSLSTHATALLADVRSAWNSALKETSTDLSERPDDIVEECANDPRFVQAVGDLQRFVDGVLRPETHPNFFQDISPSLN